MKKQIALLLTLNICQVFHNAETSGALAKQRFFCGYFYTGASAAFGSVGALHHT
jgi:hypothetical protein